VQKQIRMLSRLFQLSAFAVCLYHLGCTSLAGDRDPVTPYVPPALVQPQPWLMALIQNGQVCVNPPRYDQANMYTLCLYLQNAPLNNRVIENLWCTYANRCGCATDVRCH
jgi:hypothetical protein